MYKGLTAAAILAIIASLAMSNGTYGRLYAQLQENPEEAQIWLSDMEAMNFRSDIDFICYLEG